MVIGQQEKINPSEGRLPLTLNTNTNTRVTSPGGGRQI